MSNVKHLGEIERLPTVKGRKAWRALQRKVEGQLRVTFDIRMDVQDMLDAVEGHSRPHDGLEEKAYEIWNEYVPDMTGSISELSFSFSQEKPNKDLRGTVLLNVGFSPCNIEWPSDRELREEEAILKKQHGWKARK